MMKFVQRQPGETLEAFEDRFNEFSEQIRAAGMQLQAVPVAGEDMTYAFEVHGMEIVSDPRTGQTGRMPKFLSRAEVQKTLDAHREAEERRKKMLSPGGGPRILGSN